MNGMKVIVFIGNCDKKAGKISDGQSNTKMQVRVINGDDIHFLVMNACDNKS